MAFLSSEFVSSRANASLLVPRGITKVDDFMETLVYFFGRETLEHELDLLDSFEGIDFNESIISYQSLFRDEAEMAVDHNAMRKYVAKPKEYFKSDLKATVNAPPGYKVFSTTKRDGMHMYKVGLISQHEDQALWVEAPVGRPDVAISKAAEMIDEDIDMTVYREGFVIEREVQPDMQTAGQDVSTEEFNAFSVELEASRGLRKMLPAESKSMVTPGYGRGGTHWKFEPIFADLATRVKKDDLVILAGTGPSGNSGMVTVALALLNCRVVAYDPRARVETYPPQWTVYDQSFDPEQYDGEEPVAVISDVAVGNGNSYDISYTVKFAVKLNKRFPNIPIVYKDSIKNIGRRKFSKVYFGRGHNTEMFVLRDPEGVMGFLSPALQASVFDNKRKANLARDLFHCFRVRAPCAQQEICAPYPYVVGGKSLKPWSKHRKYNTGISVSGYINLLAGFDTTTLHGELGSLVRLVRAFVFAAPMYDASDLLGSARLVYRLVNKATTGRSGDQQTSLRSGKVHVDKKKVAKRREYVLNQLRKR